MSSRLLLVTVLILTAGAIGASSAQAKSDPVKLRTSVCKSGDAMRAWVEFRLVRQANSSYRVSAWYTISTPQPGSGFNGRQNSNLKLLRGQRGAWQTAWVSGDNIRNSQKRSRIPTSFSVRPGERLGAQFIVDLKNYADHKCLVTTAPVPAVRR